MLRIDNGLLQQVGLANLPDSEKNSLLKHIYDTLEMRVGIRLADQMSDQQLDEFERYFETKDDAGAFKWLETNFPNYKEIVQEEFEKLKNEVAQAAPQILQSSTQVGTNFVPPSQGLGVNQAIGQPSGISADTNQSQVNPNPASYAYPQTNSFNQGTQVNSSGINNPIAPPPVFQDINSPVQPLNDTSMTTDDDLNSNHLNPNQHRNNPQTPYPDQQPPAGPGINTK
jgi:succinate dehydrogenase flavin-adding protein (antitoxin of CptAB toxin-antitoxin module)